MPRQHRRASPDQIGAIFQDVPRDVLDAWEAHSSFACRTLKAKDTEPYIVTLLALQRAVRHATRSTGYFVVDDFLFGYGGPSYDPKWLVTFAFSPIKGRDR
jgi:hypothetical protein